MNWRRNVRKILLGSALALALATVTSAPARANHYSSCQNRRLKLDRKLNNDVRRYGYRSRQADHDRNQIRRLQRSCGGYGGRR